MSSSRGPSCAPPALPPGTVSTLLPLVSCVHSSVTLHGLVIFCVDRVRCGLQSVISEFCPWLLLRDPDLGIDVLTSGEGLCMRQPPSSYSFRFLGCLGRVARPYLTCGWHACDVSIL